MSSLNERLNAQLAMRKEKERLQRLLEDELTEHDKKRLTNAFRDFMPLLAAKEQFKPLVAHTPDLASQNVKKVGSLKTWKENRSEEIYPVEVDFYLVDEMRDDLMISQTLIMPIAEMPDFSLAYQIFADNAEYTLLPEVEQRFTAIFADHLKQRMLEKLIENNMMQVSVFAPPPAILEDFNILQAFNRGEPYRIENYCLKPEIDNDDCAFETWGLDIFYFTNYTKTGDRVCEACVEVSPRVWIFFELKSEFAK